jgi:hypothetical protein
MKLRSICMTQRYGECLEGQYFGMFLSIRLISVRTTFLLKERLYCMLNTIFPLVTLYIRDDVLSFQVFGNFTTAA